MLRTARAIPVACLITCVVFSPWSHAFASDPRDAASESADARPAVPRALQAGIRPASIVFGTAPSEAPAFSVVPRQAFLPAQKRQSVASTNEPKLLLGILAGALIVTGVAMITYGATSTCKGLHEGTNSCDKKTVIGAMAVSGGAVMLVVWGLSRP